MFGGPTSLATLDAADGSTDHNIDLSNLSSSTGYVFFGGAAGDEAGIAVAGIQDVNGDGTTDLLVGAWMTTPGGRGNAGSTFIVFGGAANLAALDTAGGGRSTAASTFRRSTARRATRSTARSPTIGSALGLPRPISTATASPT